MANCLAPLFFGAIVVVIFGIWLYAEGDKALEKAQTRASEKGVHDEIKAFIRTWEKDSGQDFKKLSHQHKAFVLGEFVLERWDVD